MTRRSGWILLKGELIILLLGSIEGCLLRVHVVDGLASILKGPHVVEIDEMRTRHRGLVLGIIVTTGKGQSWRLKRHTTIHFVLRRPIESNFGLVSAFIIATKNEMIDRTNYCSGAYLHRRSPRSTFTKWYIYVSTGSSMTLQ